ncbi:glycosyltransferase [Peribacillus muralis]|uniref:glycosyltransferase family 2 protein n=1 Tax=Peribacillus muralis TaxID=264697 RepID=UPI001F4E37B6|nr:glycosyltransferase family 2 protein [Peribacillus muralis]MCK1993412.1 glycosyltransferase [Peribacillus muralis]MCK2014300.1 glycosyltransferase [Peribacillus muralis]
MLPKVNVIVPIFKVEKYINRCIDSIVNQTFTNLDIILVDDGSPDNCGKIADDYKKKDARIQVIHKKNGGLSDARNHGMRIATGELTIFVDSDDWLELTMIEELVRTSLTFKADIVQAAFYYAHEDHLIFDNRFFTKDAPPLKLDNQALMAELVINERVKNFAWGKLYRTSLIKDILFKKGVLFEDVFWAHHVMQRVNSYVIVHKPLCYYFQRTDSIVASYTTRNLDIIQGLKERHMFIEENYKNLANHSYQTLLKNILIHYNLLLANRSKDRGGLLRQDLQNYLKTHYREMNEAVSYNRQLQTQLYLFNIHPYLHTVYLAVNKFLRLAGFHTKSPKLERINLTNYKKEIHG